jgi:hypothetical protein
MKGSEAEEMCTKLLLTNLIWMDVFDTMSTKESLTVLSCTFRPHFQILFSSSNQLHFNVYAKSTAKISFNATEVLLTNHIPVTMQSATSGYLTSPGYDGLHYRPNDVDIAHTLTAPTEYVAVMISFEHLDMGIRCRAKKSHLIVNVMRDNDTVSQTMHLCSQRSALVFHARKIRLSQTATYNFYRDQHVDLGFKMFFSFHQQNATPHQEAGGQFNCSVSYYSNFQQHLDCNMYEECVDGRDEGGHCWFSSPACEGKLASGSKCFFPVFDNDGVSTRVGHVDRLAAQCQEKGGELAIIQTRKQLEDVARIVKSGKIRTVCENFLTGSKYGGIVPKSNMYSQMWLGRERWVLYAVETFHRLGSLLGTGDRFCLLVISFYKETFFYTCEHAFRSCSALCESDVKSRHEVVWRSKGATASVSNGSLLQVSRVQDLALRSLAIDLTLAVCPKPHLTHAFLACDTHADCGQDSFVHNCTLRHHFNRNRHQSGDVTNELEQTDLDRAHEQPYSTRHDSTQAVSVKMFACERGFQTVHYSLVCDFKEDCDDSSDEAFCQHAPCKQFTCDSGQCVSFTAVCNLLTDCLDNSDEVRCGSEDDSQLDTIQSKWFALSAALEC